MTAFQPAVRAKIPGRVMLYGVAGSGKTMWALKVARGMVGPDGTIALADTEAGTALQYADKTPFAHLAINPPFSPQKVQMAIDEAVKGKFDAVIIDSISHFWNGPGGVLTIVDTNKSKWAAGSPAHDKLVQAILTCPIDIIITMRAKADTVIENNVPKKIGMTYIQRADSLEYEVGWIGYIDLDTHSLKIEKQRGMNELDQAIVPMGDAVALGKQIGAYLAGAPDKAEA